MERNRSSSRGLTVGQFVAPSAATDNTFKAVALALKLIPRQLKNDINRESRKMGNDVWRPIVDSHARTKTDRLVLAKGARVKPGNPMVLTAATSKRALSGGLIPNEGGRIFEFGSKSRQAPSDYERKNRASAGTHHVRRRTKRGLPQPSSGRVVYEAAAEIAPRITSLWVQLIVRKIYEAHEG